MKRKLMDIAMQLSEKDIEELVRLKKDGGKKLQELRKERRKVAAQLQKIDARIAQLGGSDDAEVEVPAKPARSAGRRGRSKKAAAKPKAKSAAKGKRGRRSQGLTEAVGKIMAEASEPLRAGQIVDALPGVGFKVKNVQDMRKRVSIVLASQKSKFANVGRGLYQNA